MSKRLCRLEFVRGGGDWVSDDSGDKAALYRTHWYWRFIAANGAETGRATETYRNRVDAIRSAELTTGCYNVRLLEDVGICYRNQPNRLGLGYDIETVNVKWVRS